MVTCSKCGRDISPVEDRNYCRFCGERLAKESKDESEHATKVAPERSEPADSEPQVPTAMKTPAPWEDLENYGFFDSITRTINKSLFQPRIFFGGITWEGGMVQPVLYAVILNTMGLVAGYLWSALIGGSPLGSLGLTGKSSLLICPMIPFAIFIGVVIKAGLIHLTLMAIGAASRSFEATLRVVCYSSSPELFNVIPIVGGLIGPIWKLYLLFVGLQEAHSISMGKAALAMVLPAVVCCGLPFVGIVGILLASS